LEANVYHLPDLFFNGKTAGTHIHFYEAGTSSRNNKVTLSQNLICFMQMGEKQISNQAAHDRFDSSNLYLLSAGNVLMTETTTSENKFKSILLFFSNEYLLNFLSRHSIELSNNYQCSHCLKLTKNEFYLNFEKSLELLQAGLNSDESLLNIKIDELLWYIFNTTPDEAGRLFSTILSTHKLTDFESVVNNNLNKNLTVSQLAFLCNMSVSTFKRNFEKIFGMPPKKYFREHKLNRSVLMLKGGKRPSEVYFELGYESLSAFSSEFKKHFGVSPKVYAQLDV